MFHRERGEGKKVPGLGKISILDLGGLEKGPDPCDFLLVFVVFVVLGGLVVVLDLRDF